MTLAIHIWVNWQHLLKVLSRLLMYNNSQSMVPFLYSDHRLLLSASTFADCCHFLPWQLRTQMLYLSHWHYDPLTLQYMTSQQNIQALQANKMTCDSKTVSLMHFQRLSICNLFSWNMSHSHDNLRRVSKSPLLHPFTHSGSGKLDWCVMRATSADSSRLIKTILAHSSTAASSTLLHCIIIQPFVTIGHILFYFDSFKNNKKITWTANNQQSTLFCCNEEIYMVDWCVWLWLGQRMASASWIMVNEKHCHEGTSFSAKNQSLRLGEMPITWKCFFPCNRLSISEETNSYFGERCTLWSIVWCIFVTTDTAHFVTRGSFAVHPSSKMSQPSTSMPHLCMELVQNIVKWHLFHHKTVIYSKTILYTQLRTISQWTCHIPKAMVA
jgi:hypothetical protein